MNSLNNTRQDNEYHWTEYTTDIVESYLIRIVGAIGVVFNVFFAVILLNRSLKHKIYNFLWCRAVCNLSVCILSAGFVKKCFVCEYDSYEFLFYQYYISTINSRVFSLASLMSDLFLILNRFLEIVKKKSFLFKMSKLLNLLICFSVPILISLPVYFSTRIMKNKSRGKFEKQLTQFGTSKVYSTYFLGVFLFETIFPILVLVVLNVVSVYKFKKLMNKKGHLTKNRTEGKLAELRFTKMVFILTYICILSRVMDFIITFLYRLTIINSLIFSPSSIRFLLFLMSLTNLFLFAVQALDGLVYLIMDRNLWKLSLKVFKLKKVSNQLICQFSFYVSFLYVFLFKALYYSADTGESTNRNRHFTLSLHVFTRSNRVNIYPTNINDCSKA